MRVKISEGGGNILDPQKMRELIFGWGSVLLPVVANSSGNRNYRSYLLGGQGGDRLSFYTP